jgi:chorismate synthase
MSIHGRFWTVTTFGESHAPAVGCVVTGVPPRMSLTVSDIQRQLDRRRPGQTDITTPRQETDIVTILSGIENGYTLGTPIAMMVKNQDQRPNDYKDMTPVPRPSHADYSYQIKYGIRASSGGGRSSARETIGRVAAGAIAEKWLYEKV